jgi:hypothetical protein
LKPHLSRKPPNKGFGINILRRLREVVQALKIQTQSHFPQCPDG